MTFDRQPVLVGELLELRPLRAHDFEALFRIAADPLIWEQHPDRDRYQEAPFRAFFEEALASGGALVALDRATGQIIGSSRFHGYDAERSVIEIGWSFLARAYWGGRYNGEMKRLMLEHAFGSVKRVTFVIGPDNRRSQRAVEKIGGVRAGTTVDAQGRERVVYELTPALYAPRRPIITLMLAVADAPTAVAWYKSALGAVELWSLGSVAGLEIAGAPFFVGEPEQNGWESPERLGITSVRVEVFCDDPDGLIARALEAGARGSVDDIRDHAMPWGPHRQGHFVDPFGHIWLVGDRSPLSPFPP